MGKLDFSPNQGLQTASAISKGASNFLTSFLTVRQAAAQRQQQSDELENKQRLVDAQVEALKDKKKSFGVDMEKIIGLENQRISKGGNLPDNIIDKQQSKQLEAFSNRIQSQEDVNLAKAMSGGGQRLPATARSSSDQLLQSTKPRLPREPEGQTQEFRQDLSFPQGGRSLPEQVRQVQARGAAQRRAAQPGGEGEAPPELNPLEAKIFIARQKSRAFADRTRLQNLSKEEIAEENRGSDILRTFAPKGLDPALLTSERPEDQPARREMLKQIRDRFDRELDIKEKAIDTRFSVAKLNSRFKSARQAVSSGRLSLSQKRFANQLITNIQDDTIVKKNIESMQRAERGTTLLNKGEGKVKWLDLSEATFDLIRILIGGVQGVAGQSERIEFQSMKKTMDIWRQKVVNKEVGGPSQGEIDIFLGRFDRLGSVVGRQTDRRILDKTVARESALGGEQSAADVFNSLKTGKSDVEFTTRKARIEKRTKPPAAKAPAAKAPSSARFKKAEADSQKALKAIKAGTFPNKSVTEKMILDQLEKIRKEEAGK